MSHRYQVVSVLQLMTYQLGQVEVDFSEVSLEQLEEPLAGLSLDKVRELLNNGEYALLAEQPRQPMFVRDDEFGQEWVLSDRAKTQLTPGAQRLFLSRTGPGSPRASTSSGRLHPPKPMPPYVPEPPMRDIPEKPTYEYRFEVAGSARAVSALVGCHFRLGLGEHNDKYRDVPGDLTLRPTARGVEYSAYSRYPHPRKLWINIASHAMGLTLPEPRQLDPIGAGIIREAFIMVMPAVQLGERLGLPSEGFFYHFHQKRLVQEYRLVGEGLRTFYATQSRPGHLNTERGYNKNQSAILVYWKLEGKVVKDQHLIHLPRPITQQELDSLDDAWLAQHGVKLDIPALLAALDEPELPQPEPSEAAPTNARPVTHIVALDPNTGQRESWMAIAEQYGLTPLALLNLNPAFVADPMTLKVGDPLRVSSAKAQPRANIRGRPPVAPKVYNHPMNCRYHHSRQHLQRASVVALKLTRTGLEREREVAVVNLKAHRVFRLGVFFDGTGNNRDNDEYKATRGNSSLSNVARLYDAYPQIPGESDKIYVSGVGTVDGAHLTPEVIDRGEDTTKLAMAMGAQKKPDFKIGFVSPAAYLTANALLEQTGAFYKWQNLLSELHRIVQELEEIGEYDAIDHIEFDVFGFSRGAALARHFINALSTGGLPDYQKPRDGDDGLALHPNLLGHQKPKRYTAEQGYQRDARRTAHVRFVGLFDTVGSFYLPGNDDEGNFELSLAPDCAERVLQLSAAHEYRENFPLTGLSTDGERPPAFFEEVFPGAHSDVGGGYPAIAQYYKTDLPEHYGQPPLDSYNREPVKKREYFDAYMALLQQGLDHREVEDRLNRQIKQQIEQDTDAWSEECWQQKHYGEIKRASWVLHYYRLQPISNALAGLALLRMAQQGQAMGIEWDLDEDKLPEDYSAEGDVGRLWKSLSQLPLGQLGPEHWQQDIESLITTHIHRPHDGAVSPGYGGFIDNIAHDVRRNSQGQPEREVFDNG